MDTQIILNTFKSINSGISNNNVINRILSEFDQLQNIFRTDPLPYVNNFIENIEQLKGELSFISLFNEEEKGILDLIKSNYFTNLNVLNIDINNIKKNPRNSFVIYNNIISEIKKLRINSGDYSRLMTPFEQIDFHATENDGVIEIIFDGNVQITNISDGKEQINDWWLIIDGYAHLFGVRREDFEIITISKNSPTRLRLKTTILIASGILTITEGILNIEKAFITNRIMLEQLKSNSLVDGESHKEYIKQYEENLSQITDKHINELVDTRIKAHAQNGNHEHHPSIKKGIETQYQFIVNGGDVKFYINDARCIDNVEKLEEAKREVRQVRDSLQDIKLLTERPTKYLDDSTNSQ